MAQDSGQVPARLTSPLGLRDAQAFATATWRSPKTASRMNHTEPHPRALDCREP
jgi:hypothetical protein